MTPPCLMQIQVLESAQCQIANSCLTFTFSFISVNKDLDCSPLDDSLTNIQWLGRMSTDGLDPDPAKKPADKENQDACAQIVQVCCCSSL